MWRHIPQGARKLSNIQEGYALRAGFGQVFVDSDPFGTPFAAQAESRAILFPVRFLDEEQVSALSSAAATIGERNAFLQWTEGPESGVVELPLEYTIYKTLIAGAGALENRLCSTQGTWGLLFSHEDHVVVGGTHAFVEALLDRFPPVQEAPVSYDVSPDMESWGESEAPGSARLLAEDMAAHYERQGARRTPLIGVSARDQGASFVAEVRRWRDAYGADIAWLPGLLAHIYGPSEAELMLDRAGLR